MSLLTPSEAGAVAARLSAVSEERFKDRFITLPFPGYPWNRQPDDGAEDWTFKPGLVEFFANAASEGRYALFTVDR